jgi:hypothetical protein
MFAGCHQAAQVMELRRAEAVAGADGGTVHPDFCFPVATLQKQSYSFTGPVGGYIYLFLVPGRAFIVFYGGQPEGDFY